MRSWPAAIRDAESIIRDLGPGYARGRLAPSGRIDSWNSYYRCAKQIRPGMAGVSLVIDGKPAAAGDPGLCRRSQIRGALMICPVCKQELKEVGGGCLSCANTKCRLGWRSLPVGEWDAIIASVAQAQSDGYQMAREQAQNISLAYAPKKVKKPSLAFVR